MYVLVYFRLYDVDAHFPRSAIIHVQTWDKRRLRDPLSWLALVALASSRNAASVKFFSRLYLVMRLLWTGVGGSRCRFGSQPSRQLDWPAAAAAAFLNAVLICRFPDGETD